jgi:hypothetical protein
LRGLGNDETGIGQGAISIENLSKDTLERLRGAKVAAFKITGENNKGPFNVIFPQRKLVILKKKT